MNRPLAAGLPLLELPVGLRPGWELDHNSDGDQVEKKSITLQHISNKHMFADTLTKPLHPGPFREFREMTGLDIINGHLKQGEC